MLIFCEQIGSTLLLHFHPAIITLLFTFLVSLIVKLPSILKAHRQAILLRRYFEISHLGVSKSLTEIEKNRKAAKTKTKVKTEGVVFISTKTDILQCVAAVSILYQTPPC